MTEHRTVSITADAWPLRQQFAISRGSKQMAETICVEIRENGHVGRGEAVPYGRYGETVETVTASIESLIPMLEKGMTQAQLGEALLPGAARCAVDCALWDLQAKQQGRAIWQLLDMAPPRVLQTAFTITLDSADGGTGAAPQGLMDNMGLPIASSLPLVHQKLSDVGLRDRIKLIAAGKMVNPAGVAAALCLGADIVCSARGFMFALGCIQALQCNENTCPTGITTHNPRLQKGLDPTVKSTRVANYATSMHEEVRLIAHSCGVLDPHALSAKHAFIISAQGAPEPLLG